MSKPVRVNDEPALYRGRYYAVVYDQEGNRTRHALRTADELTAKAALDAFRADLRRPQGKTVKALWDAYVEDKRGKAVVETMTHTWKALESRFGHLEASAIEVEHSRDHAAARRANGIQDGTIWTELGHLSTVLGWAVKRKYLDLAPYIERPPKPASKTRHLTKAEARRLLDATTMPHIRLFVVLALVTAARREALLTLTWDRVDFERGLITLADPKATRSQKGRAVVPMNRMARTHLLQAKEGAQSDYVIEWAGEKVQSVKKALATAATRAKLPVVTHHMLRHTSAVWMAENRTSMDEIAQYLGHSDSKITFKVYARFSPDHLRKAAQALEFDDLGTDNVVLPGSSEPRNRNAGRT